MRGKMESQRRAASIFVAVLLAGPVVFGISACTGFGGKGDDENRPNPKGSPPPVDNRINPKGIPPTSKPPKK